MTFRDKILERLFYISPYPYRTFIKTNKKWSITKSDLLQYKEGSIGNELGKFLDKHNFDLLAKAEKHDIFHIITNFSTDVVDEVAMQFYLYGNGKRSLYLVFVILIGSIFYLDKLSYFKASFYRGKENQAIHNFNFYNNLDMDLSVFKRNHKLV